jgi:membrane protein DedA with SNARE-associated domain
MEHLSIAHVAGILFLWVLVNQAGVPIPVTPPLFLAGAFAHGTLDLLLLVGVIVGAALCADVAWYAVGRWRGELALNPIRRRSRWAAAWIDRLSHLSLVQRVALLIGARFVPEMNPVAAGFAGASHTTLARYLPCAATTALIWGATWTGLGYALGVTFASQWA